MSDDIIERLGDFWPDNPADRKLIADSMREIERLRAELEEDLGVIAVWRRRTYEAEDEVERLRNGRQCFMCGRIVREIPEDGR